MTKPRSRRVPRVLVLADRRPDGLDEVAAHADLVCVPEARLAAELPAADALLVWEFGTEALPAAWPGGGGGPRWVHTASAGVDRLMFPALRDSDTLVTNSRGVFEQPIAEWVAGQVIALAKDFAGTYERQRGRVWQHRVTERVADTYAVVLGGGPIGRAVVRTLRALGLRVDLVGRSRRDGDPEVGTVHAFGEFGELLARADWVVCAAPLTAETEDLFDAAAFARMKRGARFVNVGRGPMVVEKDLLAALEHGRLAGAALDVFRQEPLPADSPLWDAPNLLVSPHMSADTVSWLDDLAAVFADNFARWRTGRPLRNVVDKKLGYVPVAAAEPSAPTAPEEGA
ncbi:D-2-hydroxyacid dehydrogenase [Streptomyces beihaiensis]|uniref:D-2-hydroxyacid dehydrogenase n=1 Tax=Streptomyces beihaiensis TaxID=2984495 RepID=A0ABT3U253_9ACTN|nr:D-2-hydroxyacid dehydrogenase [Streptomyces beihaiensis]MCX3063386.1 D-2-hydroxyacid dehydrogenase [Streptomyces beihaiensis]